MGDGVSLLLLLSYFVQMLMVKDVRSLTNALSKGGGSAITGHHDSDPKCPIFRGNYLLSEHMITS
jgi:hypothetical protein